jgi:superfamily II DNA or RNA helicase
MNITLRPQQEEVCSLMKKHFKMLTIAPTSAGKSIIMINNAQHRFEIENNITILVVAPKLILAQQLSEEFEKYISNVTFCHVHSGDTNHTRITDYLELAYWNEKTTGNKLIFTTYHSLHKIVKSEISFDTVYLDEAHWAVNKAFIDEVSVISERSEHFYSMTASPKMSTSPSRIGNNDSTIFGSKIHSVSAAELIENGSILPPVSSVMTVNAVRNSKENPHERDYYTLLDCILNEEHMNKVLVCAPNTKVLMALLSTTSFMSDMNDNDYDVFWITSKYGAYINDRKISRTEFLDKIIEYGNDENKKFVIFHIGILTEGFSCPGIQSCILMRNQNTISTVQTIGRCIRVHSKDTERMRSGELIPGDFENYYKPFGKIVIPTYNNNVGIATAKRVHSIVNEVFVHGNYVYDEVK